jgi:16S rRNA (cytosine1402-N4)-methyltransferase
LEYSHKPVLLREVVSLLVVNNEGVYVDGTSGTGGHGEAIASVLKGAGRLISLDRDPEAVSIARKRLSRFGSRATVMKANYALLESVLVEMGLMGVDGVLLDLGMSSLQIEGSGRGFSFLRKEPLDMRMDPDEKTTAEALVNGLSQKDLERILRVYGEEKRAGQIARAIVEARKKAPVESSMQLADIVCSVMPLSRRRKGVHPATKTFQAFRIAVNNELGLLEKFLSKAPDLINPGGRLAVISYHSLEDRMIKHAMAAWENPCSCPRSLPSCVCGKRPVFFRVHKRGIVPTIEEIKDNKRARSAVLRVTERRIHD